MRLVVRERFLIIGLILRTIKESRLAGKVLAAAKTMKFIKSIQFRSHFKECRIIRQEPT